MPQNHRYPEIDILRGTAIVLMVIYHLAFDLAYFYNFDIDVWSGAWKLLARTSAVLFLLLNGVSFSISWERASRRPALCHPEEELRSSDVSKGWAGLLSMTPFCKIYAKYLKRGLVILSWGMAISLATWFVAPTAFVKFGILHLIGASTLLLPFSCNAKRGTILALAVVLIALGMVFNDATVSSPFLFPLGLPYPSFQSLDYFPLLPWFGVILLGTVLGKWLYVERPAWWRNIATRNVERAPPLVWLGRHSLAAYLLHQPLLLGILWLIL